MGMSGFMFPAKYDIKLAEHAGMEGSKERSHRRETKDGLIAPRKIRPSDECRYGMEWINV